MRWNSVSLVTVEFHEADGDTRLVLTEEGGSLDGLKSDEQPTEGARAEPVDNLGAYLESAHG